jgi:hypothetical protein
MHGSAADYVRTVSGFLGGYYLAIATMNAVYAYILWQWKNRSGSAVFWAVVSVVLTGVSAVTWGGDPPGLPHSVKETVNWLTGPVVYSVGTTVVLLVLFWFRKFFVQPIVAWVLLNFSLILMGLSMTDSNFGLIVMKPDNVPIVGLVFLLGFFTWLATARAVENDDRIKRGLPPLEKLDDEKTLVWPDLVYIEMVCMVALTTFLIVWAICLQAPLEEPASAVKTPNPSKAPWYFLGLQEMLVYYDPWNAGVVLPSLVIVGLMAIPYLDFNKKGNGYYSIEERKFAYLIFQFGFLELWITLIILGTFLRGPNWNIFGPFEFWDPHKVLALNNVDLSQIWWNDVMGQSLPKAPPGSSGLTVFLYVILREWLGIALVLGYFLLLPPIMATTVLRRYFLKMGFVRYMVMANLLLFMFSLPIKMVLRWVFNLKYIIAIPEIFLNF